jgi:lipoprotein-anchoring transpeptidase ErfK/SrfK
MTGSPDDPSSIYRPVAGERFPIPPVDWRQMNPKFIRHLAVYDTPEKPGTIVVDSKNRFLYAVRANKLAMRYGVGVGKEGFGWSGVAEIARKSEWPDWFPPPEMQQRDPESAKWAHGFPGGPANPLGARAMYLYQNGKDTMYRIHGTNEPWSIGQFVSSGCIRLLDQDVIDLYSYTPVGTRVVVLPA